MRSGKTTALAISDLRLPQYKTHHCDNIITITIENLKKIFFFLFGKLIKPKIQKVERVESERCRIQIQISAGVFFPDKHKQICLFFVICGYLFTYLHSPAWLFEKFRTLVVNGDATERPLVNKLCDVNTHNMIEGCFSCPFFNLFIFIFTYWPLEMTNQQTATIGR